MLLSDRADNILALLLAEPRLKKGKIIFVVHSLGGLVIEQLLRNASRDSESNRKAENLLSRVRRVAFLGTPHRGALLANLGKALWFLVRPSAATRDLLLGNPQLRDLNFWYRKYSHKNNIENLILAEGRPERFLGITLPEVIGKVVSPNSADAGLPVLPIYVDETHTSICKPVSRDADVYVHLKDFICHPFGAPPQITQTVEAIERNTIQLSKLTENSELQGKALTELALKVTPRASVSAYNTEVYDSEVARQLDRLRKSRLFSDFNTTNEARKLIANLEDGSLAFASPKSKAEALSWCARVLSVSEPDEAQSALDSILNPDNELTVIAQALIMASRGSLNEALGELTGLDTSLGYGAAYVSMLNAKGFKQADEWLREAGLSSTCLDSVSLLLGIYKGLRVLFEDSEQALTWIDRANTLPPFNGRRPRELMVSGDFMALASVRQFVD